MSIQRSCAACKAVSAPRNAILLSCRPPAPRYNPLVDTTRRQFAGLAAAAAIARAAPVRPARDAMDHLLLGIGDLDRGIDWVEGLTGIRAVAGGVHPGAGTRNALAALGGRRYLEIIAPDPKQSAFNFQIDIRPLKEPRLINWAASSTAVDALAAAAKAVGHQVFGPRDGSRARPDGRTLRWKSFGVMHAFRGPMLDPVPFFIEWAAGSPHPAEDSPKGIELVSMSVEHPEPEKLTALLQKLEVDLKVSRASTARLYATLKTPRGVVTFT